MDTDNQMRQEGNALPAVSTTAVCVAVLGASNDVSHNTQMGNDQGPTSVEEVSAPSTHSEQVSSGSPDEIHVPLSPENSLAVGTASSGLLALTDGSQQSSIALQAQSTQPTEFLSVPDALPVAPAEPQNTPIMPPPQTSSDSPSAPVIKHGEGTKTPGRKRTRGRQRWTKSKRSLYTSPVDPEYQKFVSKGFFRVSGILGSKVEGDRVLYKIKWDGYSRPTWEPYQHLEHCQDLLTEWHTASGRQINSQIEVYYTSNGFLVKEAPLYESANELETRGPNAVYATDMAATVKTDNPPNQNVAVPGQANAIPDQNAAIPNQNPNPAATVTGIPVCNQNAIMALVPVEPAPNEQVPTKVTRGTQTTNVEEILPSNQKKNEPNGTTEDAENQLKLIMKLEGLLPDLFGNVYSIRGVLKKLHDVSERYKTAAAHELALIMVIDKANEMITNPKPPRSDQNSAGPSTYRASNAEHGQKTGTETRQEVPFRKLKHEPKDPKDKPDFIQPAQHDLEASQVEGLEPDKEQQIVEGQQEMEDMKMVVYDPTILKNEIGQPPQQLNENVMEESGDVGEEQPANGCTPTITERIEKLLESFEEFIRDSRDIFQASKKINADPKYGSANAPPTPDLDN